MEDYCSSKAKIKAKLAELAYEYESFREDNDFIRILDFLRYNPTASLKECQEIFWDLQCQLVEDHYYLAKYVAKEEMLLNKELQEVLNAELKDLEGAVTAAHRHYANNEDFTQMLIWLRNGPKILTRVFKEQNPDMDPRFVEENLLDALAIVTKEESIERINNQLMDLAEDYPLEDEEDEADEDLSEEDDDGYEDFHESFKQAADEDATEDEIEEEEQSPTLMDIQANFAVEVSQEEREVAGDKERVQPGKESDIIIEDCRHDDEDYYDSEAFLEAQRKKLTIDYSEYEDEPEFMDMLDYLRCNCLASAEDMAWELDYIDEEYVYKHFSLIQSIVAEEIQLGIICDADGAEMLYGM